MRGKLMTLVLTLLCACALASQASASRPVEHFVDHFTDGPFPDEVCGVEGTTVVMGNAVGTIRADSATFSGTFWTIFTAENGNSITVFAAGPVMETAPVIDEEAGTVTFRTVFTGIPEKLSVTNGRTLLRDAGTVTFVDVFEYTGDPDNPVGDFIESHLEDLHGPHPDLLSDFEAFCDVIEPVLNG
jgi:hypothetical protein